MSVLLGSSTVQLSTTVSVRVRLYVGPLQCVPSLNRTRWNSELSMISAIVSSETEHEGTLQRASV